MFINRSGMVRDHGSKDLLAVGADDVALLWDGVLHQVTLRASQDRKNLGEASYRYILGLEPELILRALTAIPPDELAAAVPRTTLHLLGKSIGVLVEGIVAAKAKGESK